MTPEQFRLAHKDSDTKEYFWKDETKVEEYAKESRRLTNLHTDNCKCGSDSTGYCTINSCNLCGLHVTGQPIKHS